MSFETRFTSEEQAVLTSLPNLIGSAMVFAEGSGLGTVKEMIATSRSFLSGKEFTGNEIISGILPNVQSMGEAMSDSREMRTTITDRLKSHEVRSKEQLRDLALQDAAEVAGILNAKAQPAEAEEYKKWILDIAEEVSKSAKEGGFLGFGGTQISQGEQELFAEVANALGVTRTMSSAQ